jgi:radical SAM superfamily enzyme YgiQ (UPF0313 family)
MGKTGPRILLLTPPMTQLNTPYPATAYLTGFLRSRGHEVVQADPAIELVLRLFSVAGLERIRAELEKIPPRKRAPSVSHFLANFLAYRNAVGPAIRFLQGKDPSLALRITGRDFLPEGARFEALEQMAALDEGAGDALSWAFGSLGSQDRAKYLASLFLDDLADVVREGVDARFTLSRYGEKLAASQALFEPLRQALESETPTLVDEILDSITDELLTLHQPDLVGLTAPFPGNVYGAFRIGKRVKVRQPAAHVVFGGGYANTELRELEEPRVFDYVDSIILDDGERPFLCLLEFLADKRPQEELLRTYQRVEGRVRFFSSRKEHDIPSRDTGTPTYDGLPLDRYLSILELLNPMHRVWSDGRWNKLTLAHGCYWKKCSFCDVTLDYIGRYDPLTADPLVDRIESLVKETGQSGFHFVDEAAPPAVLRAMGERLLDRGVAITWWGNVRFEKAFTPELCRLLARSGCVAVSGGLEVASDRLLQRMNKGVSVEQVARVARAFTDAGIMVHAYLMYGFPTQTEQETIDALERVRQLFEAGCIQSAYWHRFSTTIHSPIGKDPKAFGIQILPEEGAGQGPRFARNDLPFEDPSGVDHDFLGEGLRRALYNYMHGNGLDQDVRGWFTRKVRKPQVDPDLIERALAGKA